MVNDRRGRPFLPFRSPRAATAPDTLTAAMADLAEARSVERAVRALVAEGEEGASALALAEYRVNGALRRVDRLRAADSFGGDAA